MDWLTQILIYGLYALAFYIGSELYTSQKKHFRGLLFIAGELVAAVLATEPWIWALRSSGKSDWFLLGILGYTPISLIFWAMYVVGIINVVKNVRGMIQKRKSPAPAAQV